MGLDLPDHARARGMDLPGWMNEPMFANLHQLKMEAAEGGDGRDADGNTNAGSDNKKGQGQGPDLLT